MEVSNELGSGFLEAVYQEALQIEFALRDIPNSRQPLLSITYKDQLLEKAYRPDFICYGKVIVEVKALKELSGTEESQVLNYLKATSLPLGLLINFGSPRLEWKRFAWTNNSHVRSKVSKGNRKRTQHRLQS